ncbi:hypothetical protein [Paenibacillus riograndensis]|uniref:ACT domain-containing protein n=1 Tax=Paenibacillus riograndensis SBR5 TaxID=1073571 RepID=A0A0E4HEM2_9BACL|nr:hypothetical protein [Paenibacillus riograndensis]CQR56137.1 hypothetical protein PRIO_3734 [Paenibacillus riograndensis SBR5]
MRTHVLSILLERRPQALQRVTGLLSRGNVDVERWVLGMGDEKDEWQVVLAIRADNTGLNWLIQRLDRQLEVTTVTCCDWKDPEIREWVSRVTGLPCERED